MNRNVPIQVIIVASIIIGFFVVTHSLWDYAMKEPRRHYGQSIVPIELKEPAKIQATNQITAVSPVKEAQTSFTAAMDRNNQLVQELMEQAYKAHDLAREAIRTRDYQTRYQAIYWSNIFSQIRDGRTLEVNFGSTNGFEKFWVGRAPEPDRTNLVKTDIQFGAGP